MLKRGVHTRPLMDGVKSLRLKLYFYLKFFLLKK